MTSTRHPAEATRFEFVDGIRGLAALTVAVYHAFVFTGRSGDTAVYFGKLGQVVALGAYAVPIFIVLSGFVLMLPATRTDGLLLRGGTVRFFRRRARRIIPPYLAALVLFVVAIELVPAFRDPQGTRWAGKVPVTWDGILSHLFFVHNLRPAWSEQIDGPMWSVATEVQIYVLMPFILLPLWRRLGGAWTLGLAALAGLIVHVLAPGLDGAHYWYVGLFCGGMLVARLAVRGVRPPQWVVAVAVIVAVVFLVAGLRYEIGHQDWVGEPMVAFVFCVALLATATRPPTGLLSRVARVLESRPILFLGLISYSVYLFHSPVLGLTNVMLIDVDIPVAARLALMWFVVLPLAVLFSYGMFLLVERRFLTSHQRAVVEEVREPLTGSPALRKGDSSLDSPSN